MWDELLKALCDQAAGYSKISFPEIAGIENIKLQSLCLFNHRVAVHVITINLCLNIQRRTHKYVTSSGVNNVLSSDNCCIKFF